MLIINLDLAFKYKFKLVRSVCLKWWLWQLDDHTRSCSEWCYFTQQIIDFDFYFNTLAVVIWQQNNIIAVEIYEKQNILFYE
jgi:hypothetical protein